MCRDHIHCDHWQIVNSLANWPVRLVDVTLSTDEGEGLQTIEFVDIWWQLVQISLLNPHLACRRSKALRRR
jgi:hypothetical protein